MYDNINIDLLSGYTVLMFDGYIHSHYWLVLSISDEDLPLLNIVLISAAASSFLLIVAAVIGIFCICKKSSKTGQESKQLYCRNIENFPVLTHLWLSLMQSRDRRKTEVIQHCVNQKHDKR